MIKRPLCTACILFLVVQAVRVCIFQDAEDLKPSALESAVSEGTPLALTGTVSRIEEKEKVTAVFLDDNAVSASGQQISEPKLLVYFNPDEIQTKVNIGNVIQVEGETSLFDCARNPGNFDQKAYYQRQGIHVLVWAEKVKISSADRDEVKVFLTHLRTRWKNLLTEYLGEYYGNTMSAILLGDKSGLDEEMKKLYQKNGIGHLLAISGLHMSFIGMGIYGIFRRIGVPFVPAGILGGAILSLYTMMIGAGVSSIRALIMFLVRIGADMTGRDYDLPTSLGLAAAVICAWQPLYVTDAGFQLSFGAILGIWLLGPVIGELLKTAGKTLPGRLLNKLLESMSTSIAVSFFLMGPLLYFYFEVPPYSIFLNILVIPAMPLVMGAGLAGLAVGIVLPPAGGGLLQVCRGVLWMYDIVCTAAGSLPGSRIITGKPGMLWLAVYYTAIAVLCVIFHGITEKRRKEAAEKRGKTPGDRRKTGGGVLRIPGAVMILSATVMTGACRAGYTCESGIRVTVLDVGQGDGIYIRGSSGENCFVDGGSSDVSLVGTYRIEPYLLSCAADTLDYVFLTHGDEDHINGIAELLEGQELGVRIRNLVLPPEEYLDEKLLAIGRTAIQNGTRVVSMTAGQSLENKKENFAVTCLGPENGSGLEPGNGASLVLGIRYKAFGMLLAGDCELEGERMLVEGGRLGEYPVLKAGHHGSKNSSSEQFLEIVRPVCAVVSAGRGNRYGHPHEETVERLLDIGCSVYTTQENGAVSLRSDGESIWIEK